MTASLVLCAHGTRDPLGRETVRAVVAAVAARLPERRGARGLRRRARARASPRSSPGCRAPGSGVAGVVVPLLLAGGLPRARRHRAGRRRPSRRARDAGRSGPTTCSSTCSCSTGCGPPGAERGGPVVLAPGRVERRAGAGRQRGHGRAARTAVGRAGAPSGTPPVPCRRWRMPCARRAPRRAAGRSRWRPTCWRRGSSSAGSRSRAPTSSPRPMAPRPADRRDRAGALPRRARGVAGLAPGRLSPSRAARSSAAVAPAASTMTRKFARSSSSTTATPTATRRASSTSEPAPGRRPSARRRGPRAGRPGAGS